jgi:hypothetical protein
MQRVLPVIPGAMQSIEPGISGFPGAQLRT